MKNKFALFLSFLLLITVVHAEQYVFDNAKALGNTRAIESEIEDLASKYNVIMIVETDSFLGTRANLRERFVRHGLEKKGKPEYNMLLVLNKAEDTLFYRVSKDCALQESEINTALNEEYINKIPTYDSIILEAVRSLKVTITHKIDHPYCPRRPSICRIQSESLAIQNIGFDYKSISSFEPYAITPRAIVLHFTATADIEQALRTFAERRVFSQVVVDRDGTVYQVTDSLDEFAESTQCANNRAISIEIVGRNENDLLRNSVQFNSVARTVRWLANRFDIDISKRVTTPYAVEGLLAHSEVYQECLQKLPQLANDPKLDPGSSYMRLVRNEACPRLIA